VASNGVSRAGVLGDVHGEDRALEQALSALVDTVDTILCVGDIVDGPGDVSRTCHLLEDAGVVSVAGNHERWFLGDTMRELPHATRELDERSRGWLASLPPTRLVPTVRGGCLLCHGVADDDMAKLYPDTNGYALQSVPLREVQLDRRIDYMIGGHTHVPMVRRFTGVTVVNAGTLHRDFDPGYCVVDFAAAQVERWVFTPEAPRRQRVEELPAPAPLPADAPAY